MPAETDPVAARLAEVRGHLRNGRCCEAERAIPWLLAAVEAGLAKHKGMPGSEDYPAQEKFCAVCGEWSPCGTYQAITAALLGVAGE